MHISCLKEEYKLQIKPYIKQRSQSNTKTWIVRNPLYKLDKEKPNYKLHVREKFNLPESNIWKHRHLCQMPRISHSNVAHRLWKNCLVHLDGKNAQPSLSFHEIRFQTFPQGFQWWFHCHLCGKYIHNHKESIPTHCRKMTCRIDIPSHSEFQSSNPNWS